MRIMKGSASKGSKAELTKPTAHQGSSRLGFCQYEPPIHIHMDDLKINIEVIENILEYKRIFRGNTHEKTLLTDQSTIIISPIEPVNLPKNITPYFLLEFEKTLLLPPRGSARVFSTFPIEIGVFVSLKNQVTLVDVFSFNPSKYTQYGELTKGYICRYWKSALSPREPRVDPLLEGILELNITNLSTSWTEVTRAVFNAYSMKIFYSEKLSKLTGQMRIEKPGMAETEFLDTVKVEGMVKAQELFQTRKPVVISQKFIMEGGL